MWHYVKLIAQTKPKIVVWENVAAVLNCKHYMTYRKFYLTLNNLGYKVNAGVLNAKYFNLPQNRVRVFVVAVRKIRTFTLPTRAGTIRACAYGTNCPTISPISILPNHTRTLRRITGNSFPRTTLCPWAELRDAKFKQTNEVLSIDGIFDCLTTKQGNWIVDDRIPREKPIRHLIPQESLRFMGFEDKDFYKCRYRYERKGSKKIRRDNVPDGEIYIQAGNSIAVNVLMALFGQSTACRGKTRFSKNGRKPKKNFYANCRCSPI